MGKKLAALMRQGQIPTDAAQAQRYYQWIIAYAERDTDVDAFEKALVALRRRAGDSKRSLRYIEAKAKVLEAMKEK